MKFTAIVSTLVLAAQSVIAIGAPAPETFTFELPGLFSDSPDAISSLTINLTAVANAAVGNNDVNLNKSITQAGAYASALEAQMPQYITALQSSANCDEACCETACLAAIWLPLASAICIAICKGVMG